MTGREIYQQALVKLDGDDSALHGGPGHIVWGDENWGDEHIRYCLEHFEENKGNSMPDELEIVRWSLEELLKIPEAERDPEPEDYDGEHPELYPPTVEVVKV